MSAFAMDSSLLVVLAIVTSILLGRLIFRQYGSRGTAVQALIGVVAAVFWFVSFAFYIMGAGSWIGLLFGMLGLAGAVYLFESNKRTLQKEEDVDLRMRLFG